MVVDISDPSDPELLTDEPLYAATGESSRELRVWRSQEILIVLNTNCGGVGAHHCTGPSQNSFRFYDISGENATTPRLIADALRYQLAGRAVQRHVRPVEHLTDSPPHAIAGAGRRQLEHPLTDLRAARVGVGGVLVPGRRHGGPHLVQAVSELDDRHGVPPR